MRRPSPRCVVTCDAVRLGLRWCPLLLMLALSAEAWARMGGGHTYSGGSRSSGGYSSGGHYSSGGGGGGDIGFLIEIVIRLLIYYPQIGVPLLLIGLFVWFQSMNSNGAVLTGAAVRPVVHAPEYPTVSAPEDPNFSQYVFRDFVGLLYTQVQLLRATDLAQVRGYLSPRVEQILRKSAELERIREIRDVVVGSARLRQRLVQDGKERVTLALETNFTVVPVEGAERRLYSRENWTFARQAGTTSAPPEKMLKLGCPNCGQPGEINSDGTCPFCQQVVNRGNFGWIVDAVVVVEREERSPLTLGDAPEVGTDEPTRKHPQLGQRWRTFLARYPDFDQQKFAQRVRFIFAELQKAWSERNWELARPYETESLFQTHRYWIEAYRRDHLINQLSEIQVERMDWSNVETDAFFDALTVRVFASMIDVTVRESDGKVVSGDPRRPRRFSEYWTFIRRVGYKPPASDNPRSCPSCGAPLDRVNQAGVCEYCGTHVTLGEFDWVLAQIEQDESYAPR